MQTSQALRAHRVITTDDDSSVASVGSAPRVCNCIGFPQKLVAFVALVVTPAGCYLFEGLARVGENNGSARFGLIASDNDIDVEWIELDAAAHPPGILRGDESRPGAKEGVENNLATVCQVDQRILQHCGWFHSRMIL